MNKLAQHINDRPKRAKLAWAREFDISRPMLIALISGERNPSLCVARRIEAATGGEVPAHDWPNIAAKLEKAARHE